MAGLSDMEELLSRIQNKEITEYMREALGCYSSGAYRACVVLSYIAVFDDLRQKLAQLASVSPIAKAISTEVEHRATDQQIYESYMIDQLKSAGLITELDALRLEQIRVLRNKAAHPSGVHPSPEEARYVYFETIDKFLSAQVLKTTHVVDNILTRLKNDNYFPSPAVDDVVAIVASEVSTIHPLAIPYFVIKLVEANDSAEGTLSKNAYRFLSGLAAKDDAVINEELRKRLLKPRADDSSKQLLLMSVLALGPSLLVGLDKTTFLRLQNIMEASVETGIAGKVSDPPVLFGRLVDKLGIKYVEDNLTKFSNCVTVTFCYSHSVIRAVVKSQTLWDLLVSIWKVNAGSNDFAKANTFSDNAPQLDALFNNLSPAEALEIVLRICKAAAVNAFSAINLRDQKFSSTPQLASLAKKHAIEDPTAAQKMVQEVLSISLNDFLQKYLTAPVAK